MECNSGFLKWMRAITVEFLSSSATVMMAALLQESPMVLGLTGSIQV